MADIVDLHPAPIEDDELIENLARYADGTLTEGQVKARHHLSNEAWAAMGESDRLVELVEAAKLGEFAPALPKGKEHKSRSSTDRQFSAKSCGTQAPTHDTSLMRSKYWMVLPVPVPKPRQPGPDLK